MAVETELTAPTSSATLDGAKKLRGFVIERDSGLPAVGVAVLAVAELDDGREVAMGMLAADQAGYVSFDLRAVMVEGTPAQVHVKTVAEEGSAVSLPWNGAATSGAVPFFLKVGARPCADCHGSESGRPAPVRPKLPAIQNPDPVDFELSPDSFAASAPLVLGEGRCQVMVPTEDRKFPVATHYFTQVVRRALPQQTDGESSLKQFLAPPSGPAEHESGGARYMVAPPPPPGSPTQVPGVALDTTKNVELGQVLTFEQAWLPLGHSIGKVVYSLPLAPCESVNIAVIDWSRSDLAMRRDRALSTENLAHSQRRDRTILEVVDTALNEAQGGSSFQLGLGASANLGDAVAASGGIGFGTAQSWGKRDLTGSSLQELDDAIRQATGVVRQLHSTVVVQATQEERNVLETRTVTNHNHCHALTVQYHEVLQHLRVQTAYKGRRWALLIPYKLLDFDWQTALRHRTALEAALLDHKLAPCFDAIVRSRYCAAAYPKPAENGKVDTGTGAGHPATPVRPGIMQYELALKSGDTPTYGQIHVRLLVKGRWVTLFLKPTRLKGGPEIPKNQWLRYSITTGEAIGAERKDITKVRVGWFENDADDDWFLDGIEINYIAAGPGGLKQLIQEEGDPHLAIFDNAKEGVTPEARWESGLIKAPEDETDEDEDEDDEGDGGKPPGKKPDDDEQPKAPVFSKTEDECCEQKLLVHLKANVGHYSRACWVLQDPTERTMMLDTLFAAVPEIRTGIDPTPVAVSGNYVAFPFNGAEAPEPAPPQTGPDLTPKSSIVSLPTRGLFAETHLSHCSACEERDVTRFWQWEESPCAEKAPSIDQITPGPKGQAPTLQPATFPSPVVQVSNVPSAPDPAGLAAALKVLGTPELFRDMSTRAEVSKLLDKVISGSITLAEAKETAAKAKEALTEGGAAGGAATKRSAPNEASASEQVDKLKVIEDAAKKNLITDKQKQNAAVGVLGGEELDGAGGTAGTGGTGTAGAMSGSSASAALPLIAAFEAGTGAEKWKLGANGRAAVANRLRAIVNTPDLVAQAGLNLCGPAIFTRIWAQRDPVAFVNFTVELFEQGHSKVGNMEVRPDTDSLLGEDYAALRQQFGQRIPPEADWMVLGSLRDAENFYLDYEGRPEEDASAITFPGEVVDWLRAARAHSAIEDETNLFFTKGVDHLKGLKPDGSTDVALLINAFLLGAPTPVLLKGVPTHYIKLIAPVRDKGTTIEMDYWSFGSVYHRSFARDDVKTRYYGAIIARV
jgi:hypothetical protein